MNSYFRFWESFFDDLVKIRHFWSLNKVRNSEPDELLTMVETWKQVIIRYILLKWKFDWSGLGIRGIDQLLVTTVQELQYLISGRYWIIKRARCQNSYNIPLLRKIQKKALINNSWSALSTSLELTRGWSNFQKEPFQKF